MEKYEVRGMSCAACSARVEKAVSALPGVTSCSVSLLTNSMGVEGDVDAADVIRAVENAGYEASLKGAKGGGKAEASEGAGAPPAWADAEALKDRETPVLRRRLFWSVPVLVVLMYFSMGHMMWSWPAPAAFDNMVFLGLFELLMAAAVMVINGRFFTSGFSSLIHRAPNMDTLVALGSGASFLYSLAGLFMMILAQGRGDEALVMKYGMNLYFESAAMIPTLITIGKMLEAMSKGHTTDALKGLMELAPKTAVVVRNGSQVQVSVDQVEIGDVFVLRPGDQVPVDGVVIKGFTSINESALTGESLPVDKKEGQQVSAGTMNLQGYVECRASRIGEDTALAQIIRTVADAAATKAPLARIADRMAGIFVPAVMVLCALTFGGWLLAGKSVAFAMARGITVLVISCPCALGLATPVAVMVGSGVGARNGVLYKTAEALEVCGRTKVIALDKTGTVTEGAPVVTDVIPFGISRAELLALAASLEKGSEHPLGKAVVAAARKEGVELTEVTEFQALPGQGLEGRIRELKVTGGSVSYIASLTEVGEAVAKRADALSGEGKTPLLFASEGKVAGLIAVADPIKEDSSRAIRKLADMGIETVMLTGDNHVTAKAIGAQAGIKQVFAQALPGEKAEILKSFKEKGKVTMVGDGINDAPALTVADCGIAIGAGTDVAMDAADVVVIKSRLSDVVNAIELSRATIRNIHQNLFWAFFYNVICIPLAMGIYGIEMKPVYGAAAMALSSFFVCMNALRLNLVKLTFSVDKKEEKTMKKTLSVEGMMCQHCEGRVKKALEEIPGVLEVQVSHTLGTAEVEVTDSVSDSELQLAVETQGYSVLDIR